eukprot:scaffold111801_cov57-Phaeocystis_antarctica.AAC.2
MLLGRAALVLWWLLAPQGASAAPSAPSPSPPLPATSPPSHHHHHRYLSGWKHPPSTPSPPSLPSPLSPPHAHVHVHITAVTAFPPTPPFAPHAPHAESSTPARVGVIAAVCSVLAGAGIYAAVLVCVHSRKKRHGGASRQTDIVAVARERAIQMTRTATHGDGDADEGAGGGPEGDWARPPYLQIAVAVAGVPAAAPSADEGAGGLAPSRRRRNDEVPVGLPVAACADGSWAPASGGGADAADPESGEVTDSFQQRYQSHQHREGFVVATGFVPNV